MNPIAPQQSSEPTWLKIIRLLRWDKPEGRLILMIPALWAVFLAARATPPLLLVGVIVLGTFATSAAGCVANDLWDRDIDPQVERTRNRPLASRALSIRVGFVVGLIALVCAFILSLYLNQLSFWLCVAAVPVILLYPGAKRVFPVPQLVLSIAWGFGVLISWSAVTGSLDRATWLLWGATLCWTLGFDTVYAMSDREDDKRIGVNSSALFFGKYAPEAIAVFFAGTVFLLGWLGVVMQLHLAFWITLVLAASGWIWQYTRLREPQLPNPAYGEMFRQNVWLGFLLLGGMIAGILI
ncbi:4-hydroxybenzoate solanesyltransferase [Chroococcidiopsis sp. FACHB-1243]|uniref:4-hydroxybenzoate solanesyltransferase n=1 Tax=Chroococcidiopsis sp. [FACHB-1243] TaxID=2692781 RepID=UPI00177EBFE8|nr:4-hydroxybenzoate solanesyltransferase [Chroococcidiopsis sp. [FACHB-1243]]MBD2305995.1 4-hydroxybenzoate solanesyltransferase [Chroococcidiopsis sp. [FACHB-1243]]